MPSDFYYAGGTVVDTGDVIADDSENEFVWMPVDVINIKYERYYTLDSDYTDVLDNEYPNNVTAETE